MSDSDSKPSDVHRSRRDALRALAGVPVLVFGGGVLGCGDDSGAGENPGPTPDGGSCGPTPSDIEGPFYTANAPSRMALAEAGEPGERIRISGSILDRRDCASPRANYIVDAWHADDAGRYDNEGFKLRGKIQTGADGRFVIDTIRPGRYPDRPFVHIHIKIRDADDREVLTTQIYFADDPQLPEDVEGVVVTLDGSSGSVNFIV